MTLDTDKIDEAVLALLFLTLHDDVRAWKGFDWDALDRLHEKGMIPRPGEQRQVRRLQRGGPEAPGGALRGHVHQAGLTVAQGRPLQWNRVDGAGALPRRSRLTRCFC
jgi:hypothetical protein